MCKPGIYNFKDHTKGDTFKAINFTLDEDGTPVDLTGASIRMMVKLNATDTNFALEVSTSSGGMLITDAANGAFTFEEQIIDIDAAKYVYDIEITDTNGNVNTYIKGSWHILQDVTYT